MKLIQTSTLFKNQRLIKHFNPIYFKRTFVINTLIQNKETHKETQQFTKTDVHSKKAPTASEESVRAEKDDRSTKTLQKETVKEIHQTQKKN